MSTIGLLHPGAMGASVGAALLGGATGGTARRSRRASSARPGQASALKMVFAAWSKGSAALLLALLRALLERR